MPLGREDTSLILEPRGLIAGLGPSLSHCPSLLPCVLVRDVCAQTGSSLPDRVAFLFAALLGLARSRCSIAGC